MQTYQVQKSHQKNLSIVTFLKLSGVRLSSTSFWHIEQYSFDKLRMPIDDIHVMSMQYSQTACNKKKHYIQIWSNFRISQFPKTLNKTVTLETSGIPLQMILIPFDLLTKIGISTNDSMDASVMEIYQRNACNMAN